MLNSTKQAQNHNQIGNGDIIGRDKINYYNPTFPEEFKKLITKVFKVMALEPDRIDLSEGMPINPSKKITLNEVSEKWQQLIKDAIENFVLIDNICKSSDGQYFNKEELLYYVFLIYKHNFKANYIAGDLTSDEVLDKTKQCMIERLVKVSQYAGEDEEIISILIGFVFIECRILEKVDRFDKNNNLISRK